MNKGDKEKKDGGTGAKIRVTKDSTDADFMAMEEAALRPRTARSGEYSSSPDEIPPTGSDYDAVTSESRTLPDAPEVPPRPKGTFKALFEAQQAKAKELQKLAGSIPHTFNLTRANAELLKAAADDRRANGETGELDIIVNDALFDYFKRRGIAG
jgi:hypothetical protein